MFRHSLLFGAFIALCTLSPGHSEVASADNTPALNDRFGFAVHFGSPLNGDRWDPDQLIPMIVESGAGWIRDSTCWDRWEKSPGEYQIRQQEVEYLRKAKAAGLKTVLCLGGGKGGHAGNAAYKDEWDPDAFARWAAWMAKTLRNEVDVFEILNEPHGFGFRKAYGGQWNGMGDDTWIKKYAELLNKSAEAIKAVAPEKKVIGLGAVPPANHRMIAAGISPKVDGIVDHPYSFKLVPEQLPYTDAPSMISRDGIATADRDGSFTSLIARYREQSEKHNGPREIWLTEWGFSNYLPIKEGIYAGYTESTQAKYALRRVMDCLALGIEVNFWYDFKDDGDDAHNAENRFGVIRSDLTRKPVYTALKNIVHATVGYQPLADFSVDVFSMGDRIDTWPITWDEAKIVTSGRIRRYSFTQPDGVRRIALWSTERANGEFPPRIARVEFPMPENLKTIEVYDPIENRRETVKFTRKENRAIIETLPIPDYPIILNLQTL